MATSTTPAGNTAQSATAKGARPVRRKVASRSEDYEDEGGPAGEVMDVVVIGAGLAGLSAANLIKLHNPHTKLVVLEAADYIGGRVKTVHNFGGLQSLELGAELVHGEHTSLMSILRDNDFDTREVFIWAHGDGGPSPSHHVRGGCGYYYIGRDREMLRFDSQAPDFMHLNKLLAGLGEMTVTKEQEKMSLEEWLHSEGVSPRMISLAKSGYSNTMCANLRDMPLGTSAAMAAVMKNDGEREYRLDGGSMQRVVRVLRDPLEVWTNWPVAKVRWARSSARNSLEAPEPAAVCSIHSDRGEVVRALRVVVAVPISILSDEDIVFSPPLPEPKLDAFAQIPMEPTMKILLHFRRRVWPETMHGVICADELVPEFWPSEGKRVSRPAPSDGKKHLDHVLVAFATADAARRLGALTRAGLRRGILQQLDTMFGTDEDPHPATDAFIDLTVQDWTEQPYVRGGYSSPGTYQADREVLRQPVGDRLFFCGEYTQDGYGNMHSAIDSGRDTGRKVIESLGRAAAAAAALKEDSASADAAAATAAAAAAAAAPSPHVTVPLQLPAKL